MKREISSKKEIYFAGGCFWGVEHYFARLAGVESTSVGYANGNTANPSYEEVCHHGTGHAETVWVQYDPEITSLKTLMNQFLKVIDPTSKDRQGNDRGRQYRSGVYYTDEADRDLILKILEQEQLRYDKPIVTEVQPLEHYYTAEEYHQKYLIKNPEGYCHIQFDQIEETVPESETQIKYVKPSEAELRQKLTKEEYAVTQLGKTESPFTGKYWDHHEKGLYVDAATGEPLFTSKDKFDSGCGWPSFTKPVEPGAVKEYEDLGFGMVRTEVKSSGGDSHLGHVFDDGPKEDGGMRYCINSSALRFIPYDKLEEEGYDEYKAKITNE